jgi:outer membrane immunogenic protein
MGDVMRKLLLGSTALLALAVSAPVMAADLPAAPVYKAPALVPLPVYDWTGFYVGVNGGYSWGKSATDYTVTGFAPFSTSQSMNGWVFGGQAGYNWQFNRNWIFGLEADLQATGQHGTAALPGLSTTVTIPCLPTTNICFPTVTTTTTTGSVEQKLPWLGTARARLGFLPADRWMLYVTGGLAFGEVETSAAASSTTTTTLGLGGPVVGTTTATAAASANTTRAGWTVGAGSEWVISGPWTAKVEYLYVDLGNVSNNFTFAGLPGAPVVTTSSHVTDNIVRVGLNYRFGGPVVAKY